MNVRGPVLEVDDPKSVETSHGTSQLAEVVIRPERGAASPTTVTLWGKWTETVEYLAVGMELLATDLDERTFDGDTQYSTTGESAVVVEPDFLVDVTDIRGWVQCPRMYYLNKLTGLPLKYPVLKGTVVHEVFGDLLRGRDLESSIESRVAEAALDIGLLGETADAVADDVRQNAAAIQGWLQQGRFGEDSWRSEQTLISERFGIKGRADAVRRGMPVELKTGKNLKRSPRFQDKVQAACYGLLLADDIADPPDTGTLLYTKNSALDRSEESGDLSPAKEFSIGPGFLKYVLRVRNEIAAAEYDMSVPTGFEADANCDYCFEQDTCMVVSGRLDQESKAGQLGEPLPEPERAYFERLYRAIEEERREVHAEYRKLWEQSAAERADDDRALVDLDPLGREPLDGGRWALSARRTSDAVSKIREGDRVLASDGHPTQGTAELATVRHLDDEIVVVADEPFELRRIDVYPSELGVDRQLTALHDAVLRGDPDRKDVLFGRREPSFVGDHRPIIDNNESQNEAVNRALAAEDFALIHGPPGTGKTYTLAQTVQALVARGDRVLLSAFTNRAVDNAIEALEAQGFTDVLRWGSESGVRDDMQSYRFDRTGDPRERAAALRDAQVVAATTAACGSRALKQQQFDVAVIDEAGQLTEPGTFLATNRADRFVLVGDHEQLPPVVRAENDLQTSLFEQLIDDYPDAAVMLDRQYRMSQRIQYFASREFYDGQLRPANAEVASQRLADLDGVDVSTLPSALRDAVSFVDPGGSADGNTNPTEADRVADIVSAYLDAGVDPDDIGVIAPFRAQVAELSRRIDEVTVDTVDRFQGSSKEVIIVSFVATGELSSPIFEDYRRVNVALTRAKKALVLVGDATALRSVPFYERMLEWAG
ncbi:ATP-dependent DNA helicase Dna2 [Natronomonas pharaonis DSM 2160]|uniref:DNA helicase n=1 Tax=Natronomonas pharaonis (strain ATCC 35678 / DSM 2160 / CIP 103997 / JCM 8858 / NBRC 14720 / NCIMB 2260 / Gabara) TaxID=348780 RepID=A0A1U7EWT9_NATPD|nr:AAA domain-containing protein [Natronomonas pharaonis]CAI49563.1 ATP-dependent DNA helicase Dna2 [Natronomonas pharaonis DSM 2160]